MLATSKPIHHAIIDRADLGERTKWNYKRAVDRMIEAGVNPKDRDALANYAKGLPDSIKADTKAALRIIFKDQENNLKASATPENLAQVQALLLNFDAINNTIHVKKKKGSKVQNRLSKEQIDHITSLPDLSTQTGRRDYIVLGILLGAGLRREELGAERGNPGLKFDALKITLDNKGKPVDVLEVLGKGEKPRVIPISPLLAQHIREWEKEVGGGQIARGFKKGGKMTESLSTQSIYDIVTHYGSLIGVPSLAPHDCRRTFGRIIYDLTHDIVLVKDLMGHESVKTTQDYIGLNQNLDAAPSDYIIRPFQYMEVAGD